MENLCVKIPKHSKDRGFVTESNPELIIHEKYGEKRTHVLMNIRKCLSMMHFVIVIYMKTYQSTQSKQMFWIQTHLDG